MAVDNLVTLKAYLLAVMTGILSGYILLFLPYLYTSTFWFIVSLVIIIFSGYVITGRITEHYNLREAKIRHTEATFHNAINKLDRHYNFLKDYFISMETGIISGYILNILIASLKTFSLYSVLGSSALVAVLAMIAYVVIYGTLCVLDWIHLCKRRKLTIRQG
jgi:hypothetical protein